MGLIVLFLFLWGNHQTLTVKYDVSCDFLIVVVSQVEAVPSISNLIEHFILWNGIGFCHVLFLCLLRWLCGFCPLWTCLIILVHFLATKLAFQNSWNIAHLSWYVILYILLDFFFQDVYIYRRYWSVVFFFLWRVCLVGVLLSQPKLKIRNEFRRMFQKRKKIF